jgi:hypothetical protein
MSSANVQPPPFNVALLDKNGEMALPWQEWFLQATTQIADGSAPADASYWVSTAEALLSNERNLGALVSGYLKIAVALGNATPSTVTTIPQADITGLVAALALLAPLASPTFTGDPKAPTASPGDADTTIATTAFVAAATRTLVAPVTLKGYTVLGLPVGVQGDLAFCTNLLAPAYLAPAVGGGLVVGPVFFDGTNWVTI